MAQPEPTVLIIGAGAFGVSTAYHLAQTYRDPSRVTILDREPSPPRQAASVDINRIVRADYPSALYCNLANEALHRWFWSPELGPTFHRAGWLLLDEAGSDRAARTLAALRARGTHITRDVELADVAAGRPWEVLAGTETAGFGRAYLNPDAGWVDAATATARFLAAAVGRGVRREVGEVAELLLRDDDDDDGAQAGGRHVGGVRTADGRHFAADRIVLATGAWTSWLLSPVEEAMGVPEEDGVERQAQATAIVSAYYRVSEGDVQRMTKCEMPCVIYGRTGEVIPAWSDNGLLKYNNSGTKVVNTVKTKSGRQMSVPPADREQKTVPDGLQRETEAVLTSKLMPTFARGKPEHWRLCWDSFTPTEDLLLCQHPSIRSLYIIAGGSFCGYK